MVPIVCFVGASNVGKTTFLEKLIPALTRRGYRIGTVKHDVHGFQMDREGKDTWRHAQAGAQTIAISSPLRIATIRTVSDELPLEEVVSRYFWDEHIVLAEGFKRSVFPKVEIFRPEIEPQPLCSASDNVIAMVTDAPVDTDLPRFAFSEVEGLADFIEDRYLKNRTKPRVLVQLDGKKLPMKDFVQDFIAGGVVGMVSQLRGWKRPRQLRLTITLEDEA